MELKCSPVTPRVVHVLVVEDSLVLQKAMSRLLTSAGHTVDIAINGAKALECLCSSTRKTYDAVLMDLQMPVMDGYEATRRYRHFEGDRGLARTPVVAVSANDIIAVHQACIDAGMDDLLSKPFILSDLAACLSKLGLDITT